MSTVTVEEVDEPELVYYKPPPEPSLNTMTPLQSVSGKYALRDPPSYSELSAPRFHPLLQGQSGFSISNPWSYPCSSLNYPPAFPYPQSRGGEGDYHDVYPSLGPQEGFQQSQISTDSLIQEEVTRSAKMLFSKRNRTLLRWLNPGSNKGQLIIDVDAAWESLPQTEKLFYISQVLGRFAPQTTSLMVNPHLEPSGQAVSGDVVFLSKEHPKPEKRKEKRKKEKQQTKRKVICLNDDDIDNERGLTVDLDKETNKEKRKYKKRKQKEKSGEDGGEQSNSSTETGKNSNTVLTNEQNVTNHEEKQLPKGKKDEKTIKTDTDVPRKKRKYIKKKLVRKKYTRKNREESLTGNASTTSLEEVKSGEETIEQNDEFCEDMDIWLDLEVQNGIELLDEEVDNFWDSIIDPDRLFSDLEIM